MKKSIYFLFIGTVFLVMSCGPGTNETRDNSDSLDMVEGDRGMMDNMPGSEDERTDGKTAVAKIMSASGSNATGTATFTETGDGKVHLVLNVENVTPGEHAVHLHEKGDCSAPDATSAGGHWNPTDMEHGKRDGGSFHKGDIVNLTVGEDGVGKIDMDVDGWTIGGAEESSILNKAIIIHADPDDFKTQPSGAAGSRIACGVIEEG